MNRSTTIPSGKDLQRKWFVLDATGKTLGRLSTQAASILAGKNNVLYTPYIDMGDHVIVVNERHLKRLMNEYVRYYHEDRNESRAGEEYSGGSSWSEESRCR